MRYTRKVEAAAVPREDELTKHLDGITEPAIGYFRERIAIENEEGAVRVTIEARTKPQKDALFDALSNLNYSDSATLEELDDDGGVTSEDKPYVREGYSYVFRFHG